MADTVPYPWAVMVHFENALVTQWAVMCPRGLYQIALFAVAVLDVFSPVELLVEVGWSFYCSVFLLNCLFYFSLSCLAGVWLRTFSRFWNFRHFELLRSLSWKSRRIFKIVPISNLRQQPIINQKSFIKNIHDLFQLILDPNLILLYPIIAKYLTLHFLGNLSRVPNYDSEERNINEYWKAYKGTPCYHGWDIS